MKIDWIDIEELVREMMQNEDASGDEIEQWLFDSFNISFDQFHEIVESLIPFTNPAQSWTGSWYQGFIKDGAFIVKIAKENTNV